MRRIKMGRIGISIVLGVFALFANDVLACNNLDFNTTSNVNFNSNGAQQINLNVTRNNNNNGCSYFITFSRGGASDYNRRMTQGSSTIPYQLYKGFPYSDILKAFPEVNDVGDIVTGSFAEDAGPTTNINTYQAVLGTVGTSAVGNYTDTVTIRLYESWFNLFYTLRRTRTTQFRYDVPRVIDLSLVSTGGAFNVNDTTESLNFGNLTTGEALGFDIVLKTNAGYSVRMASQNSGKLKHNTLSATVDYTMQVNGTPVSLASGPGSPTVVASGSGTSPAAGNRIPVVTTVGSVAGKVSGNYTDFITVTVATTE